MSYILCVGTGEDRVLQAVVRHLSQAIPHQLLVLDQRHLGQWTMNEAGLQYQDQHFIPHVAIRGVYNRMVYPQHPVLPHTLHQLDQLQAHLNHTWPMVLNRPQHAMSNFSKWDQQSRIQALGLELLTPPSRLSVHGHPPTQPGWLYKSCSSVRSHARLLKPWDRWRWITEPVLFQQCIHGQAIRVHVLEDQVWACKITSQALDYREDNQLTMTTTELPNPIHHACLRLSAGLALPFTGIDLIAAEDAWYVLEANPSPGFTYYDHDGIIMQALVQRYQRSLAS